MTNAQFFGDPQATYVTWWEQPCNTPIKCKRRRGPSGPGALPRRDACNLRGTTIGRMYFLWWITTFQRKGEKIFRLPLKKHNGTPTSFFPSVPSLGIDILKVFPVSRRAAAKTKSHCYFINRKGRPSASLLNSRVLWMPVHKSGVKFYLVGHCMPILFTPWNVTLYAWVRNVSWSTFPLAI